MLHCSLCKGMFLLQDVFRHRCVDYLTPQEGIYNPDVDPHSNHSYIHAAITCCSLDCFKNIAIAAVIQLFGAGSFKGTM